MLDIGQALNQTRSANTLKIKCLSCRNLRVRDIGRDDRDNGDDGDAARGRARRDDSDLMRNEGVQMHTHLPS